MTVEEPFTVELDCGCRPMYHRPVPPVGSWVYCGYHRRGVFVVAVERRPSRRKAPPNAWGRTPGMAENSQ